jgi:hypothetical protein
MPSKHIIIYLHYFCMVNYTKVAPELASLTLTVDCMVHLIVWYWYLYDTINTNSLVLFSTPYPSINACISWHVLQYFLMAYVVRGYSATVTCIILRFV